MANKTCSLALLLAFCVCLSAQSSEKVSPAANPADLLTQALQAFRSGSFDQSVEKYRAVLVLQPDSGEAYAGLVRAYLKQEKIQDALTIAQEGVAKVPSAAQVHTAMGRVYFRQARMTEAEKEFLAAINNAHPDARAYLCLSRLYDAYSFHGRARSMLEKAQALDPEDPEIQRAWMRTLSRKEQIEWLQKYLAAPNNEDERTRYGLNTYLSLLEQRASRPDWKCKLTTRLASTEAQLKPMMLDAKHYHGFGLTVQVNGQSSKLLLDSGASGILINKKLAERAGITPVVSSKFGGIGDRGDAGSYIGLAQSLRIGELEFQNCLVEVSEKRSVLDDDGLIGTDVFSHYLVTLDFLWQKMKLEELPVRPGEKASNARLDSQSAETDEDPLEEAKKEQGNSDSKTGEKPAPAVQTGPSSRPQDPYIAPEMQNYSRIFRFGHDLLITTRVGNTPPRLFLIDTGAQMSCISPEAAKEVTKVSENDRMHVKGLSGYVKNVYTADKAVLQFSHYSQEYDDLTSFDLSGISKSIGTEVSGLLGFSTLHLFTIKIDYRDGLVDFVYTGPKK